MSKKVFDGQAGNGSSTTFVPLEREIGVIFSGSFETGSVTVEVKGVDDNWYTRQDVSAISSTGFHSICSTIPLEHRLTLSGVTTASSLDAWVFTFHQDTKRIGRGN